MIEWRPCWSASSNHSFQDEGDWIPWDGDQTLSAEQVEGELSIPDSGRHVALPQGLEEAIEQSGFGWWIETREVDDDGKDGHDQ